LYLQENTKVFEIKGAAEAALQLDLQAGARQPELCTSWPSVCLASTCATASK